MKKLVWSLILSLTIFLASTWIGYSCMRKVVKSVGHNYKFKR